MKIQFQLNIVGVVEGATKAEVLLKFERFNAYIGQAERTSDGNDSTLVVETVTSGYAIVKEPPAYLGGKVGQAVETPQGSNKLNAPEAATRELTSQEIAERSVKAQHTST